MGLLKNKKGVEGLPFKYIIIALVAALVIGIALQFTGILGDSIISQAERIDDSLTQEMICQLDKDAPVINLNDVYCNITSKEFIINVTLIDECGINTSAWNRASIRYTKDDNEIEWINAELTLDIGTKQEGCWLGTADLKESFLDVHQAEDLVEFTVYAWDESLAENEGRRNFEVECVE